MYFARSFFAPRYYPAFYWREADRDAAHGGWFGRSPLVIRPPRRNRRVRVTGHQAQAQCGSVTVMVLAEIQVSAKQGTRGACRVRCSASSAAQMVVPARSRGQPHALASGSATFHPRARITRMSTGTAQPLAIENLPDELLLALLN